MTDDEVIENDERAPCLFRLPEYNVAGIVSFRKAHESLIPKIEPSLADFDVIEVESVPIGRVTIDESTSLQVAPVHSEQVIRFDPLRVVRGDMDAVRGPLREAAKSSAEARMAFVKANFDQITAATGNVRRVGKEMSWDQIMDGMEALPIKFDSGGKPTFTLWPAKARAQFEALEPRTEVEEIRWQNLLSRKREEQIARKRDR